MTSIHYTLSMPEPNTHFFHVSIELENVRDKATSDEIRLVMPVWTPGSYLIREFSRNVLDLEAYDKSANRKLESNKDSKNRWTVTLNGSDNVRIEYRVYAFEFTVDTSYLDNIHGIVNGASVFAYVEGLENEVSFLTVIPHPSWSTVSTSLEVVPDQKPNSRTFIVPNFDTLVDSPIEIGNQKVYSFKIKNVEHRISIYSKREFNQEALVSDISNIVEATIPVFNDIPYKRYLFLVDFSTDSAGGLEHLSSTHCIAQYFRLEPKQEYHQLLSLFSHEFFHAWNVKRMRPKGLGPFDYSSETYTKSLWIAEGITSYYDDLILRRANIYTVGEYLDAFCVNVNLMISLPGRNWQSAEESSFDSWIKQYRQNENSPNVHSSYYTQGAVIGWMLDMEIRRSTHSTKSLDEVLRKVYLETYVKENRGYMDEEFENACREITGSNVTNEIFEKRVRGRQDVDFQRYFGYAGLKLEPKSKNQIDEPKGFLGIRVRNDAGKAIISNTLSQSSAEKGGLAVGDEVIAVDGLRIDNSKLSFYVANRKPSTRVKLTLARDGALLESDATLSQRPQFEYRVFRKETASEEEKALFKSWMIEDWNVGIKYEEFTPSPSRRQVLDYI